jgi:hypothetical protein
MLLIYIEIHPKRQNGLRFLSTDSLVRSDGRSPVFFDLITFVEDPAVTHVELQIRPITGSEWFSQGQFEVSKGLVIGTAQLGSSSYPLRTTERYTFQLRNNSGKVLSDGSIVASAYEIAGANRWIIGGIGLVASILGILQRLAGQERAKPSPDNENGAANKSVTFPYRDFSEYACGLADDPP